MIPILVPAHPGPLSGFDPEREEALYAIFVKMRRLAEQYVPYLYGDPVRSPVEPAA
jgi:hypothetical protein